MGTVRLNPAVSEGADSDVRRDEQAEQDVQEQQPANERRGGDPLFLLVGFDVLYKLYP